MTVPLASDLPTQQTERAFVSDLFHAISQPLTALECGLELSLRKDKSAAQLRARVETALVTAKLLHQRLLEARVLQDAAEPGDTHLPVAAGRLLLQLREDLLPVAKFAKVKLAVTCETAMVHGNEARLRNGFFHLLEFLLRACPTNHRVSIHAQRLSPTTFEVSFRNCESTKTDTPGLTKTADATDVSLRIAQRTFQAAGGDLVLTQNQFGRLAGYVRLRLAN